MPIASFRHCRRWFGVFIIAAAALGPGFLPNVEAAKFSHATLGPIDIYTSDSAENTQRFLAELLEVRRQVQELVAPVPLPEPRMQILVFARQKDLEQFEPEQNILQEGRTRVSGFFSSNFGLMASFVRDGQTYELGRASIRYFYASYLLQSAVPDAPLWVLAGVPEFFASTECRGNQVYIGGDFMGHIRNFRAAKLTALDQLMNDAEMKQYFGAMKHDNVLYHESWALWHQWLTTPDPQRRKQIQRLFAAIRDGREVPFPKVAEIFGETTTALEAARRPPIAPRGYKEIVANPNAASLVPGLVFSPATELDERYAQAMLCASTGKGRGTIGYQLLDLAQKQPQSPRVAEARAALAMGEKDYQAARELWDRARELGTNNAYAYLYAVQVPLGGRPFRMNLRSQLPDTLCASWRASLDRCLELDPGCADAWLYRMIIEAYAPAPELAALDRAERGGVLGVRPMGRLYLAVARWRLGQHADAHRILAQLQEYGGLDDAGRTQLANIDRLMLEEERSGK